MIEMFNYGGVDALITRPKPGRPRKLKLQFDAEGKAYTAYGNGEMLLARRDLSGAWTVLSVDPSTEGGLRNSLRGRPGGKPGSGSGVDRRVDSLN